MRLTSGLTFCLTLALIAAILPHSAFAGGQLRLIRDAEIEGTLRAYANPIFTAAGLDPYGVEIYLVESNQINAFVAGGMRLFLNTGLIMRTKAPNALIGVIAHETGHLAGSHQARLKDEIADRTIESLIGMALGIGAGVAAGDGGVAAGGVLLGQQVALRNLLKYTRTQESAADQAGMKYLEATHQSAEGMLSVFEAIEKADLSGLANPYLLTHPLTKERIDTVRAYVEQSPYKGVSDSPEMLHRHQRMLAKLNGYLLPFDRVRLLYPDDDTSQESLYARAISFYRLGKTYEALVLMDRLLEQSPNDPYFLEQKAQILFESTRVAEAIPLYQAALDNAPNEPLISLELAQAIISYGDVSFFGKAIELLNQATTREPENGRAWELLAIAYGQSGDLGSAAMAQAESAYARGNEKDASMFAKRALDKLPEGSPAWLRAQDILYAADDDDAE